MVLVSINRHGNAPPRRILGAATPKWSRSTPTFLDARAATSKMIHACCDVRKNRLILDINTNGMMMARSLGVLIVTSGSGGMILACSNMRRTRLIDIDTHGMMMARSLGLLIVTIGNILMDGNIGKQDMTCSLLHIMVTLGIVRTLIIAPHGRVDRNTGKQDMTGNLVHIIVSLTLSLLQL